MKRLRKIAKGETTADGRRGYRRQEPSRKADKIVWKSSVRVGRWLSRRCHPERELAWRIGVATRTLRRWGERWRENRLKPIARGRPVDLAGPDLRNAILSFFGLAGPDVSVAALSEAFPEVCRAELRELKRRYRRAWRRKGSRLIYALRWLEQGGVWAIDFTRPPLPVDGIFTRILVVRDLATGKILAALPTLGEDGQAVRDLLIALILQHGAPVVIKMDNGSAFQAEDTRALLAEHGVLPLFSPPYTPSYNGAVETGIGTLKTHVHYESARHDRPGQWTCDDVEGGRLSGNFFSRPFGEDGPSPDVAWSRKIGIGEARRRRFREVYQERRKKEEERLGILPLIEPSKKEKDAIDRVAISQALLDCGFLLIRRRRITPPVSTRKAATIS